MGQWALELVGQRFELGCNSRSSVERQKALTALREALSPRVEKLGAPWDRRRKLMSSLSSSFSFEPATRGGVGSGGDGVVMVCGGGRFIWLLNLSHGLYRFGGPGVSDAQ
ncbi:hypothetical protein CRG98_031242 [Punica granatum]|uniref:Uncharacterized protein n=1 Tax=Punica granatum TaxID=22663 RepID=A0A2I0IWK0_PUNGR|nr:hypothetical protein CRG98_031242 [Punica granatum]